MAEAGLALCWAEPPYGSSKQCPGRAATGLDSQAECDFNFHENKVAEHVSF